MPDRRAALNYFAADHCYRRVHRYWGPCRGPAVELVRSRRVLQHLERRLRAKGAASHFAAPRSMVAAGNRTDAMNIRIYNKTWTGPQTGSTASVGTAGSDKGGMRSRTTAALLRPAPTENTRT